MGFYNQLQDVIEYVDPSDSIIICKYSRPDNNNEIRQGAKLIVRESQKAIFLSKGKVVSVFEPGTYKLNTKNYPFLSDLLAIGHGFRSPIISDVYFVNTKQFINNTWSTGQGIIKRDPDLRMVRVMARGAFAFHIVNGVKFMREIFGTNGLYLSQEIENYLASQVVQAFSIVIGGDNVSVLDLASRYIQIADEVKKQLNVEAKNYGIEFTNVIVANITLPTAVEHLIDEQSGIGMASQDMNTFIQYQSARAIRDAAKQKSGLAGIGAGMQVGKVVAASMEQGLGSAARGETTKVKTEKKSMADKLIEYKKLLDDGVINQDEFNQIKDKILKGEM